MKWILSPDISRRITHIVKDLNLSYIDPSRLVCFRSIGSSSRARARIWSLPAIWQQALNIKAHYCLEVLAEHFDKLSPDDQERVLIHELLHIPKTFSGSLAPHRSHFHGRTTFRHYQDQVELLFRSLTSKSYNTKDV